MLSNKFILTFDSHALLQFRLTLVDRCVTHGFEALKYVKERCSLVDYCQQQSIQNTDSKN